jgi:hypothetical protein
VDMPTKSFFQLGIHPCLFVRAEVVHDRMVAQLPRLDLINSAQESREFLMSMSGLAFRHNRTVKPIQATRKDLPDSRALSAYADAHGRPRHAKMPRHDRVCLFGRPVTTTVSPVPIMADWGSNAYAYY